MFKYFIIIATGAGLLACSPHLNTGYTAERITVLSSTGRDVEMDSLIAPYRRELALEMNRLIGEVMQDMSPERPNSLLGQWVTDLTLQYGRDSLLNNQTEFPVICLMNTGGLRASLSKGPLTVGDIYKVMPFDNQIVALKLPIEQASEIVKYVTQSGGEPIAGCIIENGQLHFNDKTAGQTYFWVITSDFLANGGDKMLFLQKATERKTKGALLRDLLLKHASAQQKIVVKAEKRIRL